MLDIEKMRICDSMNVTSKCKTLYLLSHLTIPLPVTYRACGDTLSSVSDWKSDPKQLSQYVPSSCMSLAVTV